ncbi:glycerol-3-phosphate dehydrogenase/oxidase [Romeria aff. gracilis LEGE 07310]|uniref:Glycerol-3-phosphate dehydrogenase/oxidase n=1 Tax=Vasconcelosia minhoensis LEGE 07310 TaxID=915328 RepID=A0A8J7AZW9_9CYAN|nr:glycerol-3-phosphate dehydrogenase/oxidase [Romeria gracilis]MBE9079527.1 glycerol-3-phosphate dehydrogenase/oxidase [Romeria aff. gracilis LEGE 07310]
MRDFSSIDSTAFDLIVIGGGVNGAAVARDGALRGLKTILVEKGDFGGGTTSWSTRLVHGGLRYLEYFEFNLVRESLREREILLNTAPHLVHPVQLTLPLYDYSSRSYWEIQAGMILYDILSFDKSLPNHRMLRPAKLRQLFRAVNPNGVKGGSQYYDGQAEYAERLCLEIILSAQAADAVALNYVEVSELQRHGDRVIGLTCKDGLSDQTFTIGSHERTMIVNTSGPWVDRVCQQGVEGSTPAPIGTTRKIGGTKGSHILVNPFPGAPDTAFYVEAAADNRPFFIVPFLGMYLIGTTDLKYEGDLDPVKADNDEVDYLIAETNQVLPSARLTRESVRFTYSGIRPLPYAEGKKPGSISRNHILFEHAAEGVKNMVSLIGGKLTTHRRVGEEAVDWVYQQRQQPVPPSPTRHQPLPGAILPNDRRITQAFADYGDRVQPEALDHLFHLYGAKAVEVLALIDESADLAEPIVSYLPDIKAQIVYAIRAEMAYNLIDICRRRTSLAIQANYGYDALAAIAETLQRHCGWDEERCDRAIQNYVTYMRENCIPDYVLQSDALETPKAPAIVG